MNTNNVELWEGWESRVTVRLMGSSIPHLTVRTLRRVCFHQRASHTTETISTTSVSLLSDHYLLATALDPDPDAGFGKTSKP